MLITSLFKVKVHNWLRCHMIIIEAFACDIYCNTWNSF